MFMPDQFRAKADEYIDLANSADSPESAREFHKLERSFRTLADNEQWLSDHHDQTVHAADHPDKDKFALAGESLTPGTDQDQILRYLGAAVMLRWSTLPMKLQRELFDAAGDMGEILDTDKLRGEIARFLHRYKDDKVTT